MVVSTSVNLPVEIYLEDHYFNNISQTEIIEPNSGQIWHNWFNIWLNYLQDNLPLACGYELSLRLTNDQEIQALNYQYLEKNYPTDVLAFSALESENHQDLTDLLTDEPLYLGDLIISVDTAKIQAQKYQHSLEIELAWLASHGLLHLIGWDHPDQESLFEMLQLQAKLLTLIGLELGDLLAKSYQEYSNQY
jgi:probable rRNA maturation factor